GLSGRGARLNVPAGSGEALVIDESYNANPASMRATLQVLAHETGRKIAVLGEMRELGEHSDVFHAELSGPIEAAGVDYAILVGEAMGALAEALEGRIDFVHVPDAATAGARLDAVLGAGDAVLVKGSNGVRLSTIVAALTERAPA
ncbi:MAG: UDP-N-acetylmuramoylalanyl-D-glutamyl-2, 6-diaminopimelate--D-alanyl-D-alanine ligase, partial [Sphingomonadales bacterium]